jgi:TP901 family phage tail tape measure protein
MVNLGIIRGVIELEDKFTTTLEAVERKMNAASTKMDKMGTDMAKVGGVMSAGITLPLVGMAAQALATSETFGKAMNGIEGVLQPTAKQMEQIRDIAIQMGADTAFSATDAANAMLELGKAGFTTEEAMGSVDEVLNLAAASGLDMASSAEMAARTMNAFGLETQDLAHINDVLAKAVNTTSMGIDDLRLGFQYVGPVAQGFGISLEQTSAALGIMRDRGVAAETAGRSLREAMNRLANPTNDVTEAMEKLGIKSFEANGKMLPLNEIVGLLQRSGLDAATSLKLFGDVAGGPMLALVKNGQKGLEDLTKTLQEADGDSKKLGETLMKGLPGAMERLRGSVETAWLAIGRAIEPTALKVIWLLEKTADMVTNYVVPAFQGLPGFVQTTIIVMLGLAAAIGPVLLAIGGLQMGLAVLAGSTAVQATIAGITTAVFALGNSIPILTARLAILEATGMTASAAFGALGLAIAAVWVAWKIGNSEGVKNSIAEWALSADNLTAKLFRAVTGQEQMTREQARAAVAATAASQKLNEQSEAAKKVAESTATFADELNRANNAMTQAPVPLTSLLSLQKQQEAALSRLTAEQRANIMAGEKMGMSSKEITEAMNKLYPTLGLTENAVGKYTKSVEDSKKKVEEAAKTQREYNNWLGERQMEAARVAIEAQEKFQKAIQQSKQDMENAELAAQAMFGELSNPKNLNFGQNILSQMRPWELMNPPDAKRKWADSWSGMKEGLQSVLGDIPGTLMQAFQGGGNIWGAVKSIATQVGSTIGGNIGAYFGGPLGQKLGAAIGSLAGPALEGLKKLFGIGINEQVKKFNKEIDKVRDGLMKTYGNMDNLEEAANRVGISFRENWGHQGQAGLQRMNELVEQFEARLEAVKLRSEEMLTGFNQTVQGVMASGGATVQVLQGLENQALISITGAVAAGMSWGQAFEKAKPGLDALRESYKQLGIESGNAALTQILLQEEIMTKNATLITGIDGLGLSFRALSDLGLLNIDTFNQMTETGELMYLRLQASVAAAGGTTRDALLPMQQYLHEAEAAAKRLGIPLDENTQMLIDQSKELGLWQEQGQDATSKLLEGMNSLVGAVNGLVNSLMGVVNATNSIPRRVDSEIYTHHYNVRHNDIDAGDNPGRATGSPGMMFENWGRSTTVDLHNKEAVVTPTQGQSLAGMVGDAIRHANQSSGGGSEAIVGELRGLRNAQSFQNKALVSELRDLLNQLVGA